jgi:hypothetical protein
MLPNDLSKKHVTWPEWRRAIRSPLSQPRQELIGSDIILSDAALEVPSRLFGRIVNRTARVNSHPTTQTDSMNSANCWSAAVSVWIISPFFAAGAWLFGAFGFLVWYWR